MNPGPLAHYVLLIIGVLLMGLGLLFVILVIDILRDWLQAGHHEKHETSRLYMFILAQKHLSLWQRFTLIWLTVRTETRKALRRWIG